MGIWKSLIKRKETADLLRIAKFDRDGSRLDEARALIAQGANVNAREQDGNLVRDKAALHWAIKNNNEALCELLLDSGANPNQGDVIGQTPLQMAAMRERTAIIKLLLKRGADPDRLGSDRAPRDYQCVRDVLEQAKERGHRRAPEDGRRDIAAALVSHGAGASTKETAGTQDLPSTDNKQVGRWSDGLADTRSTGSFRIDVGMSTPYGAKER